MFQGRFATLGRDVWQCLGIQLFQAGVARDNALLQRIEAQNSLCGTCRTEGVTDGAFQGGSRNCRANRGTDGAGLCGIIHNGGCPVQIDIVDICGHEVGLFERLADCGGGSGAAIEAGAGAAAAA